MAALQSWEEFAPSNVAVFKERRDAAVDAFKAAGFGVEPPSATMYLWTELPAGVPSAAFAEQLMAEEGVIVLPGSAFGPSGEGFFRVSFVVSPERLREAAARAGRVLSQMRVAVT